MFKFVLLSAILAVAASAPAPNYVVPPVLLSKVQVAPTQLQIVKEPHIVTQPEPVLRDVPIPYKTVQYTAPHVIQPAPVVVNEPVVYNQVIQPEVHVARKVPVPVAVAPIHAAPVVGVYPGYGIY